MNKSKKLKILIVLGVVLILLLIVIILVVIRSPKEEKTPVSVIPSFRDDRQYNFSIATEEVEESVSTLYTCGNPDVPEYLRDFVLSINPNLEENYDNKLLTWSDNNGKVLTYNVDSTVLDVDLSKYPEAIKVSNIEEFISESLHDSLQYYKLELKEYGDTEIYSGNRAVDGKEVRTSLGTSDYFVIEDGYLTSARITLAEFVETNSVAPLITNTKLLEQYLSNTEYPKEIVLDTTDLYTLSPENYEDFTPEINYDTCSITEMEPKLYFDTCNAEYIYDVYLIAGICDVEYRGELFSVPYKGYINAIDPEYVYVE